MNSYIFLLLAIIAEVIATSLLKMSDGFTKLLPTVFTLLFYGIAFYLLSLTLKTIPIGVAYAIWSGVGIVVISLIGLIAFKQHLDFPAIGGITLIMLGCLVINLFSKVSGH